MIAYLLKGDIILINKLTIQYHGGNFMPPYNLLNENALDYVVEAVSATMFDAELYPTIPEKAGVYLFNIISNHIFSDGNKRTGLEAALLFLRLNGYKLSSTVTNTILTQFILEVASGMHTLTDCQNWLKGYIENRFDKEF